jgi:hypothetical protein
VGFAEVFESLGAHATLSSSVAEVHGVVSRLRSGPCTDESGGVILIPCDPALEAAARDGATGPGTNVVAATSGPAGVSALMAFTFGLSTEENVALMDEAACATTVISAESVEELLTCIKSIPGKPGLATLYCRERASATDARGMGDRLSTELGLQEVEVVYGGQNTPGYLLALE